MPPPGGYRPRPQWGRFGPRGPRFGGWGGPPPPQYFEYDEYEEPFGEPPYGDPYGDRYGDRYGEPPFGEPPFGEPQHHRPPFNPNPELVKEWLSRQHPNLIKDMMYHSKFLLEKMGIPVDLSVAPKPLVEQQSFVKGKILFLLCAEIMKINCLNQKMAWPWKVFAK